jgi:hypothetical protein
MAVAADSWLRQLFAAIPDLREAHGARDEAERRDARIAPPFPAMTISDSFDIRSVAECLAAGNGGYEVVHSTEGLEVGV